MSTRFRPGYRFKPGQTIRFTYNPIVNVSLSKTDSMEIDVGEFHDRYKEVFVLHPNWRGKLQAIDLKRLTAAEREVLEAIFDPQWKKKRHKLNLVNDVLSRMDPPELIKNPLSFYYRFVKVFLRNKDAYRTYHPMRMSTVTVVKPSTVKGNVTNPKPLFHGVKEPEEQPSADFGGDDELDVLDDLDM